VIKEERATLSLPWAITFADMALLLLCFFIMLTTMRGDAVPTVAQSKSTGTATATATTATAADVSLIATSPAAIMASELSNRFSSEIAEGWLKVNAQNSILHIRFGTGDAFDSGSDEITYRTARLLDAIGETLVTNDARIVVVGHTDDQPISTGRFRDNWDLSSARAVSVIRELIQRHDIAPTRLEAKGYADTRPQAPNDSEWNRSLNRRIEIEIIWPR
jgi:chemotaxis protein MotB